MITLREHPSGAEMTSPKCEAKLRDAIALRMAVKR